MNPAKQKADELINGMYPQTDFPKYENAIKCAIKAAEERLEEANLRYRQKFLTEVLNELKSRCGNES